MKTWDWTCHCGYIASSIGPASLKLEINAHMRQHEIAQVSNQRAIVKYDRDILVLTDSDKMFLAGFKIAF